MTSSENRTLFVGNLSERVTEALIYELFLQAGPLESVRIPMQNGRRRAFGFVEFKHEVSVLYAAHLFHQTSLYGRMLKLQSKKTYGRFPTNEDMFNTLPNPLMTRLGPPVVMEDQRFPSPPVQAHPPILPSIHKNPYLSHRRMPSHLMPSPAKKRIPEEVVDKNNIPDALNYRGLFGKEDQAKKKIEKKQEDDLRSKLKKKKKKKKDHSPGKKHSANEEKKDGLTSRGGGFCLTDYPPKSYFKNAVNQIKQHCNRNNRGSYDLSSKHKLPRHIRFNT